MSTTTVNAQKSKNLATLVGLCISGIPLSLPPKMTSDETFDSFAKRLQSRNLLDSGASNWYEQKLNTVIQAATDIKLYRETMETMGSWKLITTSANQVGKQGAKCSPTNTSINNNQLPTIDPSIPAYLYKPNDLTYAKVNLLLKWDLCPLCRINNHPLNECGTIGNTYNISLKADKTNAQPPVQNSNTDTPTANQVTNLQNEPPEEPGFHDVFANIIQAPM